MRWLAGLIAGVALALPACAADAPQVEVVLSLPGGRDHFDAGEPLRLDLAFVARAAGVELREFARRVAPDRPTEDVIVRAEDGGDGPWVYDRPRWLPGNNDVISMTRLPAGDAVHRQLVLNDWVRFERPGRYAVQVKTRRVPGLPPVLTNAVTVQIDLPSPVDEVTRARELAERIRTERNEDDARRLAHELGWLGGDVAADLQLDLLLNRDGANPLRVNVEEGLWRARDRRRVVQRLERAIADPAQLLNARGDVLWHLTTLRFSLDGTAPLYLERVAAESLRFGYVQRVAQSLPQRSGESLIDAVAVVLDVAEPDSAEAAAAVGALQAHFDDIDPYLIEWLLSGHLAQFTGPQLRAGLHSALDRRRDVPLDAALSALGRRWPEDLAPYALAEACAERPALLRSLAGLRPGPLPEADACLRRRLLAEAAQPKRDLYWLAVTLEYVARLASPALVPDVEALLPALEARSQKAELNNARDYLARSAPAARR